MPPSGQHKPLHLLRRVRPCLIFTSTVYLLIHEEWGALYKRMHVLLPLWFPKQRAETTIKPFLGNLSPSPRPLHRTWSLSPSVPVQSPVLRCGCGMPALCRQGLCMFPLPASALNCSLKLVRSSASLTEQSGPYEDGSSWKFWPSMNETALPILNRPFF